jgi:hypothetical protein
VPPCSLQAVTVRWRAQVDGTRYAEPHTFAFDGVLCETCTGDDVYLQAVAPLVGTCLRRCHATCFAYGQTGSGKTHTMRPLPVRAAAQLLEALQAGGRLTGASPLPFGSSRQADAWPACRPAPVRELL